MSRSAGEGRAAAFVPIKRLWVNPDCGLKTRTWPEVEAALSNMVTVARTVPEQVGRRTQVQR
ncbi:hypothetical protein SGO26_25040 [Cupriavidus metallidurans]|uniref:hypothetical protein n=1 Tax=Cupriavidus TaxID=106589 RepID=UPI00030AAA53|nr:MULTISPECIES: hypothetical protein [Cupriavidus]